MSQEPPDNPARTANGSEPAVSGRVTVGQWLLALVVALVVTAIWRKVLPLSVPRCCDARVYLTMAADPSHAVRSPYSSRVFVPWLTHLLGGPPKLTFDRISLACMVANGPLVYAATRRLGPVRGPRGAIGGFLAHWLPWSGCRDLNPASLSQEVQARPPLCA
jgi:hypothetical protein